MYENESQISSPDFSLQKPVESQYSSSSRKKKQKRGSILFCPPPPPPPPPVFLRPSCKLYCYIMSLLCKKIARAPGGVKNKLNKVGGGGETK